MEYQEAIDFFEAKTGEKVIFSNLGVVTNGPERELDQTVSSLLTVQLMYEFAEYKQQNEAE